MERTSQRQSKYLPNHCSGIKPWVKGWKLPILSVIRYTYIEETYVIIGIILNGLNKSKKKKTLLGNLFHVYYHDKHRYLVLWVMNKQEWNGAILASHAGDRSRYSVGQCDFYFIIPVLIRPTQSMTSIFLLMSTSVFMWLSYPLWPWGAHCLNVPLVSLLLLPCRWQWAELTLQFISVTNILMCRQRKGVMGAYINMKEYDSYL